MVGTRYSSGARAGRSSAMPWRQVDVVLLASVLAINALGLLMIYSSTRQQQVASVDPGYFLQRQAMYAIAGVTAMVVVALVDYRVWRELAPVLWTGTVFVLLLVLTPLGSSSRGAQAWFQLGPISFEPSEVAKITTVLVLAAFCANQAGVLDARQVMIALGLAGAPVLLIYLQPDLGSAMVFGAIVMGVLLVGGARPRHIAALTAVAAIGVVAVFQLGVLKDYQLDRLTAFLDPQGDPARSTYNLRQSTIAIAAGGLSGRGLFEGTQTNLSFVPEQHTDFIFTAVGEELGFVGAASLLGLFGIVLWRMWRTALLARDAFGTFICVGVLSIFLFQVFENVGMTMGITPIAGIPLPFMSYGGSSLVSSYLAVGLVQSVHMRR